MSRLDYHRPAARITEPRYWLARQSQPWFKVLRQQRVASASRLATELAEVAVSHRAENHQHDYIIQAYRREHGLTAEQIQADRRNRVHSPWAARKLAGAATAPRPRKTHPMSTHIIARCAHATLPVSALRAHPQNPRQDLGDLTELTDSIRAKGIIQTVLVMPHPTIEGDYQILMGHRRVAAARAAGLEAVEASIAPADLTEAEQLEIMLTENLQRTDLSKSEELHGVQALFDLGKTEKEVAKGIGKSLSTVKRYKKAATASEALKSKLDVGQVTLDRVIEIQAFERYPEIVEKLEKEATGYSFSYYLNEARDKASYLDHSDAAWENLTALGVKRYESYATAEEAGYTSLKADLPAKAEALASLTVEDLTAALPEGVNLEDIACAKSPTQRFYWYVLPTSLPGDASAEPQKSAEQLERERMEAELVKNLASSRKAFAEHIMHAVEHPKTLDKEGFAYGLALAMVEDSARMHIYSGLLGFALEGATYGQQCQDFFDKACTQTSEKLLACLVAASLGITADNSVSARRIFELNAFNPASTAHSEALRAFTTAERLFGWNTTPDEKPHWTTTSPPSTKSTSMMRWASSGLHLPGPSPRAISPSRGAPCSAFCR